jgi:hypothetical protein
MEVQVCAASLLWRGPAGRHLVKKMGHITRYDIAPARRWMMRIEMITLLPSPPLSCLIYSVICVVMEVIIGMVSTLLAAMTFGDPLGWNRLSCQQVATVKVPLVHVIERIWAAGKIEYFCSGKTDLQLCSSFSPFWSREQCSSSFSTCPYTRTHFSTYHHTKSFIVVMLCVVLVCMYVCMYVCMHVCMCVYVCMHVCVCTYVYMHVCTRACMYVHMCACMYADYTVYIYECI